MRRIRRMLCAWVALAMAFAMLCADAEEGRQDFLLEESLRFGMTVEEVCAALGEPDEMKGDPGGKRTLTYRARRYDCLKGTAELELSFLGDHMYGLIMDISAEWNWAYGQSRKSALKGVFEQLKTDVEAQYAGRFDLSFESCKALQDYAAKQMGDVYLKAIAGGMRQVTDNLMDSWGSGSSFTDFSAWFVDGKTGILIGYNGSQEQDNHVYLIYVFADVVLNTMRADQKVGSDWSLAFPEGVRFGMSMDDFRTAVGNEIVEESDSYFFVHQAIPDGDLYRYYFFSDGMLETCLTTFNEDAYDFLLDLLRGELGEPVSITDEEAMSQLKETFLAEELTGWVFDNTLLYLYRQIDAEGNPSTSVLMSLADWKY